MQRTDPSAPDFQRPADADDLHAQFTTGSGRRPSKKIPVYNTLKALGVDVSGKSVDLASLPLLLLPATAAAADADASSTAPPPPPPPPPPLPLPVIDTARLADELLRTGKHAPCLATIALSEAAACVMYDLAANEAGLGPQFSSRGNIRTVIDNMRHLVGHVIPVFSQVRAPSAAAAAAAAHAATEDQRPRGGGGKKKRIAELNAAPIEPLAAGGSRQLPPKPHAFAMQPVNLSTVGSRPRDQGVFLAQGVIVSNKCFNFPEDDDRRVVTGRNPAFEETICYVLITHSYEGLSYAALGPPSTKTGADGRVRVVDHPDRNTHEHTFGWRAFMEQNAAEGRRCSVSAFGFTDIKQTGKDTTRKVVPWSIEHVAAQLADMRASNPHGLGLYLRDLPMVAALNAEVSLRERPIGGMDLRRFLLIETLLRGTPLEPLLDPPGQRRPLHLPAPTVVPGGARGLYDRMKSFCDARRPLAEA